MKASFVVYGRVQGVFFRHNAKKKAEELGLVGFIRNHHDGEVEGEAIGDKENLVKFLKWCEDGPEMAKVEKVDVGWSKEDLPYSSFEIVD